MTEIKVEKDVSEAADQEIEKTGTILDRIVEYTESRVKALKQMKSPEAIKREAVEMVQKESDLSSGQASLSNSAFCRPFAFEKVLAKNGISFICEVKKASPSRGVISEDFPYIQIARQYEAAGAAAISVLTEPAFFLGSDSYLSEIRKQVRIPILRKDFIIDAYQIYEAKILGADAVLLICALLSESRLREFIAIADSLGLSALVEVHTEEETRMALAAGARIVGINNRDLHTFITDIGTTAMLRPLIPEGILVVSESGIATAEDIAMLEKCGADAVLIGETFMKSDSIEGTMKALSRITDSETEDIETTYDESGGGND